MLRYAITSLALYPGDTHQQQTALAQQATRWASEGIDFIQLREKNFSVGEQATLARNLLHSINLANSPTKFLINSRADVAVAMGAHGVHLTSNPRELTPTQIRRLYDVSGLPAPIISVSCHTVAEASQALQNHADAILFAPVFEKPIPGQAALPGQGLEQLHAACLAASPVPVYALGGATLENAPACLLAGAAGIAGIRLFANL